MVWVSIPDKPIVRHLENAYWPEIVRYNKS